MVGLAGLILAEEGAPASMKLARHPCSARRGMEVTSRLGSLEPTAYTDSPADHSDSTRPGS